MKILKLIFYIVIFIFSIYTIISKFSKIGKSEIEIIDGHEYIKTQGSVDFNLIHSESCKNTSHINKGKK